MDAAPVECLIRLVSLELSLCCGIPDLPKEKLRILYLGSYAFVVWGHCNPPPFLEHAPINEEL